MSPTCRVRSADQVIGEMEQVHGDARLQPWVAKERKHLAQLGPGEVERLEVLETARAKHTALEALPSAGESGEKPLGVDARQRREYLLVNGRHEGITPCVGVG